MNSWLHVVQLVSCDAVSQCDKQLYHLKGCFLCFINGAIVQGVIHKNCVFSFIKNDLRCMSYLQTDVA